MLCGMLIMTEEMLHAAQPPQRVTMDILYVKHWEGL